MVVVHGCNSLPVDGEPVVIYSTSTGSRQPKNCELPGTAIQYPECRTYGRVFYRFKTGGSESHFVGGHGQSKILSEVAQFTRYMVARAVLDGCDFEGKDQLSALFLIIFRNSNSSGV